MKKNLGMLIGFLLFMIGVLVGCISDLPKAHAQDVSGVEHQILWKSGQITVHVIVDPVTHSRLYVVESNSSSYNVAITK